ncbi:MAG: hypothetical protein JNM98_12005, partial [Rhodocyclaceae bacterium]|nr:hypothetical protein [Rhodocyclaceae bacterium]
MPHSAAFSLGPAYVFEGGVKGSLRRAQPALDTAFEHKTGQLHPPDFQKRHFVDNATAASRALTLHFPVTDGAARSQQTVQIRVFDLNRPPQLSVANHAVQIGQPLSLPIRFGVDPAAPAHAITVTDPDGAAQTRSLAVSFSGLPAGAAYDAATQRLSWTPGPGQAGDYVITAQAGDGRNTSTQTFTLRVVADASANAPAIAITATPGTPVLPGQLTLVSVRADSWSGIAQLSAAVRGSALGADSWQSVALDGAGRLRLTPTQPGLVEVRVSATDRDGFSATRTQTLRVKDPLDTTAPQLTWRGALAGATADSQPIQLNQAADIAAGINDAQLMGYRLEIAAAGSGHWQTLAQQ